MNYLTISEVSKITGISRKNLIYYDSIDLLKPEKYGDNGYRYYTFKQIELCFIILSLKLLNLSLADIRYYIKNRTPELSLELFENQLKNVDKLILHYNEVRSSLIHRNTRVTEGLTAPINKIVLKEEDEEIYYISSKGNLVFDYNEYLDIDGITNFYDELFSVGAFTQHNVSLLLDEIEFNDNPFVILNMTPYYLMHSNTMNNLYQQIIKPKGTYATLYHYGSFKEYKALVDQMFSYLLDNNIHASSSAYLDIIWDETVTPKPENYILKLSVKIY